MTDAIIQSTLTKWLVVILIAIAITGVARVSERIEKPIAELKQQVEETRIEVAKHSKRLDVLTSSILSDETIADINERMRVRLNLSLIHI